ncbi:hypothetical protein DLAC_06840 [Tieghemostelium lacteum]|uniref:TraB family protein n=1 Tax=Tieghemostelium lacteum TaxID=361077 RepID=A0A151ZDP9_TIELA|nr:hypothetical protein DLAC_06840 [Tieghemostelium lacteum]|eukprot:KYQ92014.1 hypothetical protein DLAC_06840 [Tieghemostelium lacteum]
MGDNNEDIIKTLKNKGLDKNVRVLKNENTGAIVYLVGTHHLSNHSSKELRDVIEIVKPDTVFLELSLDRKILLVLDDKTLLDSLNKRPKLRWFNDSIVDFTLSLVNVVMYYSSKFTDQIPTPIIGNEFRIANQYAQKNKCKLVLGDRDHNATYNRIANSLDWSTLLKLSVSALAGLFYLSTNSKETVVKQYNLENQKYLVDLDQYEGYAFPEPVNKILVDERDRFMASTLRDLKESKRIIAVVGKGHVKGISKYLNEPTEGFYLRRDLEEFTEPTFISKYSYPIMLATPILSVSALQTYAINRFLLYRKLPVNNRQKLICFSLLSVANTFLLGRTLTSIQNKFD